MVAKATFNSWGVVNMEHGRYLFGLHTKRSGPGPPHTRRACNEGTTVKVLISSKSPQQFLELIWIPGFS